MKPGQSAYLDSPSFLLGLMIVLVLATAVADLSRPLGLVVLTAAAASAVAITPDALCVLIRRLLPLVSFGLVGFCLVLLAPVSADTPVYALPLWGRPVPEQSVRFILSLWVKSVLVVAWVTVFARRISERDFLEGLTGLRLPPRVTALSYLMVRNMHTVADELRRLLRARDARGRPRGLHALRVAAAIAGVLIVRLGRKAETQGLALVARGFDGGLPLLDCRTITLPQLMVLVALGALLLWTTHL